MISRLEEIRLQKATERGFIQEAETDLVQIQNGLETMHYAPLNSVGQFVVEQEAIVEK